MKLDYDYRFGTFLRRPNRFIAHIDIEGTEVISHVPNTGRLGELLIPGATVLLSYHPSDLRKTQYELRMVLKEDNWVSIDSQLPNILAQEALVNDVIEELSGYSSIRREVVYQNSRFDIMLTGDTLPPCYVEVKGVTLRKENWSFFPDAPTERGRRHIEELIYAVQNGYRAALLFIVQLNNVEGFSPNAITDPGFAKNVRAAYEAGVEVLAYRCHITPEEVTVVQKLPVKLEL